MRPSSIRLKKKKPSSLKEIETNTPNYWVYILETTANTFYTGYAKDLKSRFEKHLNKEGAKFTRSFTPKKIAAAWKVYGTRSDAMRIEAAIKKISRVEKCRLVETPDSLNDILAKQNLAFELKPLSKDELPVSEP